MSTEWSDWIAHDGAHVPGPVGTPVRIRWESGDVETTFVGFGMEATIAAGRPPFGSWLWAIHADDLVEKIVAYQLRKGIEDELDALREMVEAVFDTEVDPVGIPSPAPADDPCFCSRFLLTGGRGFDTL